MPINFLLRSAREQRSIIYSFISYLKISPIRIQFKVLTKRADLNKHTEIVRREMEAETDPNCRILQEDYLKLINRIGSREATTRRFFVAFEYEQVGRRGSNEEADAIASLQTAARTAANYLKQCGNEVLTPGNEDEFTVDVLYNILCRQESSDIPLPQRVQDVLSSYIAAGKDTDAIPCTEFFAPRTLDFTHAKYICVDGQYRSYLLIPSYGYKSQVAAGWLSLLVNAGDGIDIDLFLTRQPKERMVNKLGQQLRINRSKIREASDTNSDFDDLDGAIRSGYFLKEGLSNNEDFYYMNILITMTADNAEDLEWREREMRKLLISQDLNIVSCSFREEQGFLSSLPLTNPEKHLYERSKRNVLTSGAASCYPFTAYELSDDNGILLGVNKYNNSLVIVDIFNSAAYKNANIAIMGTSGAGKTFTLQLMALRMRRKGTQVFIIAPLKGHEFLRACRNTGGEFIQISPASKNCINVMEIRPTLTPEMELIDELDYTDIDSMLARKIQQMLTFFSLLVPDMTNEEEQMLDEALIDTYAEFGITHDNASLYTDANHTTMKPMPILGDLHRHLKSNELTQRLATIVSRFVTGSAQSFNRATNVDLTNKYIVLDISELKGKMLPVGMMIALDYVWDTVKSDRTKRKMIFLDELWRLVGGTANRLVAEFCLEVFLIGRGYGAGACGALQNLSALFDFEGGQYGRAILNNCKTKIILNLEPEEAEYVKDVLKLSHSEIRSITQFERGEVLLASNSNKVPVIIKISDTEKRMITTDRAELEAIVNELKETTAPSQENA